MYRADLHVHSQISDGSFCAEEIFQMAKENGITHLSFTEHDTTAMAEQRVQQGKAFGIAVIKGIEISALDKATGKKAHILGYGYEDTTHIESLCAEIVRRRNKNCRKQIDILIEEGFRINRADVEELSCGFLYKQHILDYLVKTHQTDAIFGNVYRTIFKNGGRCDLDIEYVDPIDAVRAICEDGGFAVLAHAGQQDNFYLVEDLVKAGLSGIELFHHANDKNHMKQIRNLCEKYQLFMSGGSDFHGKYSQTGMKLGDLLAHESSEIMFKENKK